MFDRVWHNSVNKNILPGEAYWGIICRQGCCVEAKTKPGVWIKEKLDPGCAHILSLWLNMVMFKCRIIDFFLFFLTHIPFFLCRAQVLPPEKGSCQALTMTAQLSQTLKASSRIQEVVRDHDTVKIIHLLLCVSFPFTSFFPFHIPLDLLLKWAHTVFHARMAEIIFVVSPIWDVWVSSSCQVLADRWDHEKDLVPGQQKYCNRYFKHPLCWAA